MGNWIARYRYNKSTRNQLRAYKRMVKNQHKLREARAKRIKETRK